jgi:glycosyltransferase involved in cell wall biosynthesis
MDSRIRVGIVFKNFAGWTGLSHIGLNVAALTNARVLRQHGVHVAVFPVRNNVEVIHSILEYEREHHQPLTHVVISAPWMTRYDLEKMIEFFPRIQFVVECHSNVGFLQADPGAVGIIRAVIALSHTHNNILLGGNSKPFTEWASKVYGTPVVLLPNLYPISKPHKNGWNGSLPIKIGVFGAVRPQKNFMTAAAAALLIQNQMQVPVELHMSTGGEGDGGSVSRAIDQMVRGIPDFTLIRHLWEPWQDFVSTVEQMDLLIQPSYTESFNMVTADGIVVGVPSVVSEAIRWAPNSWKADSDDVLDVTRVGIGLLNSRFAVWRGLHALKASNRYALKHWFAYLGI